MIIVFGLLATAACAVSFFVVVSHTFAWYEQANRHPELMEGRMALSRLWMAVRLMALEAVCLLSNIALYPLGWVRLPAKRPGKDETPVILLHGLFHSRSCWLWTRYWLRQAGFSSVYAINLPPWKDVESLTERVAKKVDALRHKAGIDKVHLVGHSMGGIIARNYLQIRGGAGRVDRLVMLGTPNGGSKLAALALSPLAASLMPGSELLQRLDAAAMPPETKVTAVYSRHDNIVIPFDNGRLQGADNVELSEIGHTALLYHPQAFQAIVEGLTEDNS